MQYHAIIVAGGTGARMNTTTPKQFIILNGKPVLAYTLEKFIAFNSAINIVLVLAEEHISTWNQLKTQYQIAIPHSIALGGPTRFHSVKSGLNAIQSTDGLVAIHDGARPLVTTALIAQCFSAAEKYGNAIPAIAPPETVRLQEGAVSKQLNRSQIRLIQTPQCFSLSELKNAYNQPYNEQFTDDASVLEAAGGRVHLTEGERSNLKITTADDLAIATALLNS